MKPGQSHRPESIEKMRTALKGRPAWNRGRAPTAESVEKRRRSLTARWADPAFRQAGVERLLEATRKRWSDPDQHEKARQRRLGKPSTAAGKKWSQEARQSLRAIRKEQENRPEVKEKKRAASRRVFANDPAARVRFIAAGRGRPSRLECEFLDAFERALGVTIARGVQIGRYVVDGMIGKVILEVDGHFWHALPGRKAYDVNREVALKTLGYAVLRIPESFARTFLSKGA